VVPITEPATGCRERALKALSDLPPFSPVLDRLLATLSSESVPIARVSDIIEMDTVIAGNVLKLVNSALYGRRGTVNSVRHAVSLLGINKLRNAVFAMSIARVWGKVRAAPGWSISRFNLHSVACALLCDCLAQRAPVEYPEGAFAAGLFHDLGHLLIAMALHKEYAEIQRLYESGSGSIVDCELEVIGVSHADLSTEALALWNLPEAIQQAVRFHHAPEKQSSDSLSGTYSLALTIQCAEEYVENAGMSLDTSRQAELTPGHEPFSRLGIEFAEAHFLEQFRAELVALAGVFH
jgi:HD-like signal output (HDOD) protein